MQTKSNICKVARRLLSRNYGNGVYHYVCGESLQVARGITATITELSFNNKKRRKKYHLKSAVTLISYSGISSQLHRNYTPNCRKTLGYMI